MMEWRTDSELFQLVRSTLYTPVVGDILDALGYYHQFLPPAVQPMRDDMVIVGRAMPVLLESVSGPQPEAFLQLARSLDQLEPGEVYITTEALNCASWGEIMTATAKMRGARRRRTQRLSSRHTSGPRTELACLQPRPLRAGFWRTIGGSGLSLPDLRRSSTDRSRRPDLRRSRRRSHRSAIRR